MANVEDHPFHMAASELVADLDMARAEREGRVEHLAAGVYTVNADGGLEYVGTHDDVIDEMNHVFTQAYAQNADPLDAYYLDDYEEYYE